MTTPSKKQSNKKASTGASVQSPGGVSDIQRFANLFQGFSGAHGQYNVTKADQSGKVQGKASTVVGPATLEHYQLHLEGKLGLGIIPLRDDDTVLFACIDYDKRNMDHVKAEKRVRDMNLPLILCRSKSGGGHFYTFFQEPVIARDAKDLLAEWTSMLGMAHTTEQYPKASVRADEIKDPAAGGWLNMPYFNADATQRYAVIDGKPASLSLFLDKAEQLRYDFAKKPQSPVPGEDDLFYEGPPCLQYLHSKGGFVEGTRNDGMMATLVYLRKRHPDTWEDHADSYNHVMAKLPSDEMQGLIKSNRKKEYVYKCKGPPINAHCQKRICMGRLYGVGSAGPDQEGVDIGGVVRYDSSTADEPLWRLEVNGRAIMVTNSQLYSRDEFNRAAMAQCNIVPIHMQPGRWLKYLNNLIQSADTVALPEDAGPMGQLWGYIQNFLTQQAHAVSKEELWLGKPYREGGFTYFRSYDLFRYLDSRKVKYPSQQAVYKFLETKGAEHGGWNIKEGPGKQKFINWWKLPSPDVPVSPEATPVNFDDDI